MRGRHVCAIFFNLHYHVPKRLQLVFALRAIIYFLTKVSLCIGSVPNYFRQNILHLFKNG